VNNCAWAVGDGQGGSLRDSDGLAVDNYCGGKWAVGGVCGVGSSDIVDRSGGVGSSCNNADESSKGDNGELHLDGWLIIIYFKSKSGRIGMMRIEVGRLRVVWLNECKLTKSQMFDCRTRVWRL